MSEDFDRLYQQRTAAERAYAMALIDTDRLRQLLAEALARQDAARLAYEEARETFHECADARATFRQCPRGLTA